MASRSRIDGAVRRRALAVVFFPAAIGAGTMSAEGPALPLPIGVERAERVIRPAALSATTRFLADDLLEGRAPASRGDRLARRYIATRLQALGLEPGALAASWEQPFDVLGITTRAPEGWSFRGPRGEARLSWWDEYIAAIGLQADRAGFDDAQVVFVGYGIVAPEYGWDDFKGADLRGKVLVMLNSDPDWDPDLFEGKKRLYYGRWDYKYESAARQGAVGAIVVHTTLSAGYPWHVVQSSWTGEQFDLPAAEGPRMQATGWATEEAAKRLAALGGFDLAKLVESARSRSFRPVPLGITTSLHLEAELRRLQTANVAALLRGRDPVLRDQVVVYTAHHDHLGVGKADATGDTIYNGALDNASGVAQLLAIADAFAALPAPPRRSVLFLAVAGEESGLLGSSYFASHPTFPAGKIAANINFDGANIWGKTRDIALIGRGKSDLDRVLEAAAARQGRRVVEEAFPDRGHFYRSDQFSFAKIGVPCLYFDNGMDYVDRPPGWGRKKVEEWEADHYHQPSDEFGPDWDLAGVVEDARLGFVAGLAVAEADRMPAWLPKDEFEATRKQALADARAETPESAGRGD